MVVDSVETFVREFARALENRDEQACSELWGRGALVLADRFETVAEAPEQLEPFLAGAWSVYEFLDLTSIEFRILDSVALTGSIVRVLVRCSFFDRSGAHLVDGDFEYVLRRDDGELTCHVGINISAEPNLTELAESRGFTVSA